MKIDFCVVYDRNMKYVCIFNKKFEKPISTCDKSRHSDVKRCVLFFVSVNV